MYVADTQNNRIRKVNSTGPGVVMTLTGCVSGPSQTNLTNAARKTRHAGYADGQGNAALFREPCGVTVDAAGNVYVADTGNNTVRKVTAWGVVTTLAGYAHISDYGGGGFRQFSADNPAARRCFGNLAV